MHILLPCHLQLTLKLEILFQVSTSPLTVVMSIKCILYLICVSFLKHIVVFMFGLDPTTTTATPTATAATAAAAAAAATNTALLLHYYWSTTMGPRTSL